jgi:SOS-response transcriptional repressor LexA
MTLQRLAGLVGCARSYLSSIENGRRENPPSAELLGRLEEALGFEPSHLVEMGAWQGAPEPVKREVARLHSTEKMTRRLLVMLEKARTTPGPSEGDANGSRGRSLDDLYQSGELRRLIDAISPATAPHSPPGGAPGGNAGRRAIASILPLEIPLINSVAAGYPTEFTDLGYPASIADEYVRSPDIADPDAFAARVVGDSMQPEYREGDIVIFSPARPVKSGMDCFARLEPDHESTFKRIYFEPGENGEEGALIRLQPLNPAFPARTYPRERIAGLYAAVSVTRAL